MLNTSLSVIQAVYSVCFSGVKVTCLKSNSDLHCWNADPGLRTALSALCVTQILLFFLSCGGEAEVQRCPTLSVICPVSKLVPQRHSSVGVAHKPSSTSAVPAEMVTRVCPVTRLPP